MITEALFDPGEKERLGVPEAPSGSRITVEVDFGASEGPSRAPSATVLERVPTPV